jgi:hypothetical protein
MSESNSGLVVVLLLGGAFYLWYQQQNQMAQQEDVGNTPSGDIDELSSEFDNYVESQVMGNTRGERNNNPGNIRRTVPQIAWQGLSAVQNDSAFCQFDTPQYGIRALHVNLLTYYTKYGLNTITKIINRWAPPQDGNNTAAYIANVSNWSGIAPNQVIDMTDATTAAAIVNAIILQENGSNPYQTNGIFSQAMAMS